LKFASVHKRTALTITISSIVYQGEVAETTFQEVFYQTGIGGIIYSKYFTRAWSLVFLKQTVEKARKLGLLRKQKFRSRTRAIEVAGT
jgi:hypothetical protein